MDPLEELGEALGEVLSAPIPVYAGGLNREAWLTAFAEKLRPMFTEVELELPEEIYISVGFPSKAALGRKTRRIGEHWHGASSEDGKPHIFISPLLSEAEATETLVHELVHAALPSGVKHGPAFKRAMGKVGLVGKPTADHAGEELRERLKGISQQLGPYPHAGLRPRLEDKKQTTRMLKVTCPVHEDYIVRASRKVIEAGLPVCGMCMAGYTGSDDAELPPQMVAEGYEPGEETEDDEEE